MSRNNVGDVLNQIEIILIRQLAGTLTTPMMIFDPDGTLLFYNEPAEPILGLRFEETGRIVVSELAHLFAPTDADGQPIPLNALPSHIALAERRPASKRFRIRSLDGSQRDLEVSALPLIGRGNRFLGSFSVFWEMEEWHGAASSGAGGAQAIAPTIVSVLEDR